MRVCNLVKKVGLASCSADKLYPDLHVIHMGDLE